MEFRSYVSNYSNVPRGLGGGPSHPASGSAGPDTTRLRQAVRHAPAGGPWLLRRTVAPSAGLSSVRKQALQQVLHDRRWAQSSMRRS